MIRVRVTAAILAAMMTQSVGAGVATSAVIEAIPEETETAEEQTKPVMEYIGDYRVTAYAFYEGNGENYATAGGYTPTPYWTCATTSEFPFGTILFIEGIGEVQVQDRGGFGPGIIDLLIGDDPMSSFEDKTRAVYVVHY
jgi:3D (Asp-Asp-Asp) domain-containing protein